MRNGWVRLMYTNYILRHSSSFHLPLYGSLRVNIQLEILWFGIPDIIPALQPFNPQVMTGCLGAHGVCDSASVKSKWFIIQEKLGHIPLRRSVMSFFKQSAVLMPSQHWPSSTHHWIEAALQYSGSFHGNMPWHLLVGQGSQDALLFRVGEGFLEQWL